MNTSIEKVLAERGSRYGEFVDHAFVTQSIKRAMVNSNNWRHLSDDMKEALEMIAHKMGRILNGDPKYIDSWTDLIGYAKLVENNLIMKEVKNNEIIPTPASKQSEQTKPLDPSLRAAKNWQDSAGRNGCEDQRVR